MTNTAWILLLAAVACVLIAAACGLWWSSTRQQQRAAVAEHLERSLGQVRGAEALLGLDAVPPLHQTSPAATAWQRWCERMRNYLPMAGLEIAPKTLCLIAGGGVLLALLAAWRGGWGLGVLVLVVYSLVVLFVLWRRSMRMRKQLLEQLPPFLDNVVRLITIGSSTQSAFVLAAEKEDRQLGQALQKTVGVLKATNDLGHAIALMEQQWKLQEFGLLAAVFRMSTKYGGRMDLVLERVAAYIRDRQSAERELHAMSAEVRMSAWILALLPIAVGAFIMVMNPGYFMRMWEDPSGRNIIFTAAALEVIGSALLYRLSQLR